jgi:hypothetical protein
VLVSRRNLVIEQDEIVREVRNMKQQDLYSGGNEVLMPAGKGKLTTKPIYKSTNKNMKALLKEAEKKK